MYKEKKINKKKKKNLEYFKTFKDVCFIKQLLNRKKLFLKK